MEETCSVEGAEPNKHEAEAMREEMMTNWEWLAKTSQKNILDISE